MSYILKKGAPCVSHYGFTPLVTHIINFFPHTSERGGGDFGGGGLWRGKLAGGGSQGEKVAEGAQPNFFACNLCCCILSCMRRRSDQGAIKGCTWRQAMPGRAITGRAMPDRAIPGRAIPGMQSDPW